MRARTPARQPARMPALQFHPPWVGEAGGRLIQNLLPGFVRSHISSASPRRAGAADEMWGTRFIRVRSLPGPSATADEGSFDFAQDGHPQLDEGALETEATRQALKPRLKKKLPCEGADVRARTPARQPARMPALQFHPPWVGEAGGRLIQNLLPGFVRSHISSASPRRAGATDEMWGTRFIRVRSFPGPQRQGTGGTLNLMRFPLRPRPTARF